MSYGLERTINVTEKLNEISHFCPFPFLLGVLPMAFVLRKEWGVVTTHVQNPLGREGQGKNQPIQNDICKGTHGTLLLLYKELAGKIVRFFGACRFKFYYEEKLFLV